VEFTQSPVWRPPLQPLSAGRRKDPQTGRDRQYGGLDTRSVLGYAVSQFFTNGGQQAYILRLAGSGTATAGATLGSGGNTIAISARNAGDWADNYAVAIKNQTGGTNRFRVQVLYVPPGATTETVVESFENLSMTGPDPQGRFVNDVINNSATGSNFITATASGSTPPADTTLPSPKLTGGNVGTVINPGTGAFETALTTNLIYSTCSVFRESSTPLCSPPCSNIVTTGAPF